MRRKLVALILGSTALCAAHTPVLAAAVPASAVSTATTSYAPLNGFWEPLPSSNAAWGAFNGSVTDFAQLGSDLYVAGAFEDADGIPAADYLARWDGTAWSAVGSGPFGGAVFNARVSALAVFEGELYAGGSFTDAGGVAQADYVAKWDGNAWSALASPGSSDGDIPSTGFPSIEAMAVDGSDLYIGGGFENVAGIAEADRIAKWDGDSWSALGTNGAGNGAISGGIRQIIPTNAGVYAAGFFDDAGGVTAADHVAFFDGAAWQALGSNGAGDGYFAEDVHGLAMHGSSLYAGGDYLVARWNGTAWLQIADGDLFNGTVRDLVSFDGRLVAAGVFKTSVQYIASWDGNAWSSVGPAQTFDRPVLWTSVLGADLYVGGGFRDVAGAAAGDHAAVWRGQQAGTIRADGRIRKGSGSLVGNNIYNTTGSQQTLAAAKRRTETVRFEISVQNDGSNRRRFVVHSTGPATSMYQVRYFRGTTEITAAVASGTYQTPRLARGGTHTIVAKVKVLSSAATGSSVARLIAITPLNATSGADSVKFVVSRR